MVETRTTHRTRKKRRPSIKNAYKEYNPKGVPREVVIDILETIFSPIKDDVRELHIKYPGKKQEIRNTRDFLTKMQRKNPSRFSFVALNQYGLYKHFEEDQPWITDEFKNQFDINGLIEDARAQEATPSNVPRSPPKSQPDVATSPTPTASTASTTYTRSPTPTLPATITSPPPTLPPRPSMAGVTLPPKLISVNDPDYMPGNPFVFGAPYDHQVNGANGSVRVHPHQDIIMNPYLATECTKDSFPMEYRNATTLGLKVPNLSAIYHNGWVRLVFQDSQDPHVSNLNRRNALLQVLTRNKRIKYQEYHIDFGRALDTSTPPKLKLVPNVRILEDPEEINNPNVLTVVNYAIVQVKFLDAVDIAAAVDEATAQVDGLTLGAGV